MDDILGKVASMLLAAMLFCMMPFCAMAQRQDTAGQMYLLSVSTRFVDSICNTGFVSEQMMQQFYGQAAAVPQICQIQLLHETKELVYDEEKDIYAQVSTFYDEEDIWEKVRQKERYCFAKNDFIQVVISCKRRFQLLPGQEEAAMDIRYGGVVKYEIE